MTDESLKNKQMLWVYFHGVYTCVCVSPWLLDGRLGERERGHRGLKYLMEQKNSTISDAVKGMV